MHSFAFAVLLVCLFGVAVCQTDSIETCPTGWNITCTRPLSEFTEVKRPRNFCKSIGYVANGLCHTESGQSVTPNGCCEYGK